MSQERSKVCLLVGSGPHLEGLSLFPFLWDVVRGREGKLDCPHQETLALFLVPPFVGDMVFHLIFDACSYLMLARCLACASARPLSPESCCRTVRCQHPWCREERQGNSIIFSCCDPCWGRDASLRSGPCANCVKNNCVFSSSQSSRRADKMKTEVQRNQVICCLHRLVVFFPP